MSDIASVIEKIQKLKILSGSSNANEAAAAAAVADKLIDQYRISQADLEESSPEVAESLYKDDSFIYETGKVTTWKSMLIDYLTAHYGVHCIMEYTYPNRRKVTHFRLFGRQTDIYVTKYMFSWLQLECKRLADMYAKGQGRVYVSSYCAGFVVGVNEQLKLSRAETRTTASSSALVKLDARSAEARTFAHAQYAMKIGTKKGGIKLRIDQDAYESGQVSGKNIHLGPVLDAKPSKALTE